MNFCSKCGKACRGFTCMTCIKSNSKKQQLSFVCPVCGGVRSLSAAKKNKTCRRCFNAAWKINTKVQHGLESVSKNANAPKCQWCGKQISWKDHYRSKGYPATCSARCSSFLFHSKKRGDEAFVTRAQLESRICSYIRQQARYCTMSEVQKALRITGLIIRRNGILITKMNAKCGFFRGVVDAGTRKKLKAQVIQALQQNDRITFRDCLQQIGVYEKKARSAGLTATKIRQQLNLSRIPSRKLDFDQLKRDIVTWIQESQVPATVVAILHKFHIDHATWKATGWTVDELNAQAGLHVEMCKKSWFEEYVAVQLLRKFGSAKVVRQRSFSDCKSRKGWRLRFDFYIRGLNALIEVDGSQHADNTNAYWNPVLVENDRIKEAYAVARGYSLHRIKTTPRVTFETRVALLLKELMD